MKYLPVILGLALLLIPLNAGRAEISASQSLLAEPGAWKAVASEGANVHVRPEQMQSGAVAMRIDFDFTASAGFGGMVLDLPIELPENYDLALTVHGQGTANNLEFKLDSPDKQTVWWVNRRAFEWPTAPTRLVNLRKKFQFAWGPGGDKPLTRLERIEVIVSDNQGGRGTVWIDDLRLIPLPPVKPYTGIPVVSASSGARDLDPLLTEAGGMWIADDSDRHPWLAVDFGQARELGGLVVYQDTSHVNPNFDIETSEDSKSWTTLRKVRGATALPSEIALPDLQTRWVRLSFSRENAEPAPGVSRIQLLDSEISESPNAFWHWRAMQVARGIYPRSLIGEQSFWTVVGWPDDDSIALINQEGQVEVNRRGFSLEPFIVRDGKLLTWADGTHTQSLRDGWMPMPTVVRRIDGLELHVSAVAANDGGASALHVSYTVRNTSGFATRGRFVLVVRPLQVLPPWQDLNITGGWTRIRSVQVEKTGLLVNDERRVLASKGFHGAASVYDAGDPIEMLAQGNWPAGESAVCPQESASGLLWWDFAFQPIDSATYLVCVPLHGIQPPLERPRDAAGFQEVADHVAADWAARINRVKFHLPPAAQQFADTIRATQAYILVNHNGPGFEPGSRNYARSWIRDGSMISAAMLELGHEDAVRRFIEWYAPFQFASGRIPCVVDTRGADPVPENDSNGEFLWLIANYHRHTGDAELVRRQFSHVKAAIDFVETMRAQRLTEEFSASGPPRQEPGKPPVPGLAFRGLVPESISHEGYSAKPMHSFWDDFFTLRGLKDAAYLAQVVDQPALAAQWQKDADDFRGSVIDSIRLAQKAHGIDYLPGCVELGDFDSTSSTILVWPVDEAGKFPREWVDATFDRYWREFVNRRDQSPQTWEAYTPYELRHVGALLRLGEKDRALAALNYYLKYQRPENWHEWAEVVFREESAPRVIGDMPHTWCGSDFLNSALAMFEYTQQPDNRLVVFAGVPEQWLADPGGVGFDGLHTEFGMLSATAKENGPDRLIVHLEGAARPPGGFELRSPFGRQIRSAFVDGRRMPIAAANCVRFGAIPATVELSY
jgi:hypothetical protein